MDNQNILYWYNKQQLFPFYYGSDHQIDCCMYHNKIFYVLSNQNLYLYNMFNDRFQLTFTLPGINNIFIDKTNRIYFINTFNMIKLYNSSTSEIFSLDYQFGNTIYNCFTFNGKLIILSGDKIHIFEAGNFIIVLSENFTFLNLLFNKIITIENQLICMYHDINKLIEGMPDAVYVEDLMEFNKSNEIKIYANNLIIMKKNNVRIYQISDNTIQFVTAFDLLDFIEKHNIKTTNNFVYSMELNISDDIPFSSIISSRIGESLIENFKIQLDEELINYNGFLKSYHKKRGDQFIMDVNPKKSFLEQFGNIIPYIYRLNDEMKFLFEQVDEQGEIISYGRGVTRQVYTILRKEIDLILKNKLENYNNEQAFNLGKLIYFCNNDGKEKFNCLHPIFFLLICNESDYPTLIKKFKESNHEIYLKQYWTFQENLTELINLEIGLLTIFDYMQFLLANDLTEKEINLYKEIVKGFNYFLRRKNDYQFIKQLPILFLIKLLITNNQFDAYFTFKLKGDVSNQNKIEPSKTFMKCFQELSHEEKLIFLQNITGTQYYHGNIVINFMYDLSPIILQQNIYDEELEIEDNLENNENHETRTIIINLDDHIENFSKPMYQISTCHSELMINIPPTKENIQNIIKILTVEDNTLKQ